MPVLTQGTLHIDHSDAGAGPPVVLIHSSVSGNRQWRSLVEALRDRHRVLAVNLFGYGETTPWPAPARQTLYRRSSCLRSANRSPARCSWSATPSAARWR